MKDAIEHVVRDVAKFPKDPTPRSFGMEIVPKMLDVMGRELEPPTLQYVDRNFKQVEVIPSNGSWEMYVKFPDRPGQLDLRFR